MKRVIKKKKTPYKNIIIFILVGLCMYYLYSQFISADNNVDLPTEINISAKEKYPWWNENYAFRRQLTNLKNGKNIINLNHAALVLDGKSLNNGSDLKILGVSESKAEEINFEILSSFNEVETFIQFESSSNFSDYFLYYGNKTANSQTKEVMSNSSIPQANVNLDYETSPTVSIFSNKKWVLLYDKKATLSLNVNISELLTNNSEIYSVIDKNENKIQKIKVVGKTFNLSLNNIDPGIHTVNFLVKKNDKSYLSNTVSFLVSKPVYVSWTIDWEGIDPIFGNLNKMSDISTEFAIPMTHFFNPRIFIFSRITEKQRNDLVSWVKERHAKGDEIAMHMHMQHDLVEAAGVDPKEEMLGWNGDFRGYDLPSSVYSYEEYLQILTWAKNQFKKYNLPEPIGYRAGGWFAEEHTLRAIEDAGFVYDSSGRESFPLGTEGFTQKWQLTATSQPYHPSYEDQNAKGDMKLLEIPNNGSDSYWSDTNTLIDNFYLNYTPGEILKEETVLVYLSHPEWFEIDDPKLRTLFTEINKYRFETDDGPVVFVTLEDYLKKTSYID